MNIFFRSAVFCKGGLGYFRFGGNFYKNERSQSFFDLGILPDGKQKLIIDGLIGGR